MKDLVCKDKKSFGYHGLYAVLDQTELPAGSILFVRSANDEFMVETNEAVDIFDATEVKTVPGSWAIYKAEVQFSECNYVSLTECRFPTEEELNWYQQLDLI